MFRVCKFYGWGLDDVRSMDWQDYNQAVAAMLTLDASDKLWQLRVIGFPDTKPDARRDLIKDLRKQLEDKRDLPKGQAITNEQLAKILSR